MKRLIIDFLILSFLINHYYLWYESIVVWAEGCKTMELSSTVPDDMKKAMLKMGPYYQYYATYNDSEKPKLYVIKDGNSLRLKY